MYAAERTDTEARAFLHWYTAAGEAIQRTVISEREFDNLDGREQPQLVCSRPLVHDLSVLKAEPDRVGHLDVVIRRRHAQHLPRVGRCHIEVVGELVVSREPAQLGHQQKVESVCSRDPSSLRFSCVLGS